MCSSIARLLLLKRGGYNIIEEGRRIEPDFPPNMDRTALSRATDPSSAPTPGYLYNDIAKSLTSPQACSDTLAYLLSRLSKTNPHVKKKSLKVLSKIVSHPASRGMMKRAVVTNPPAITSIKEAISHRGSTDAVTGDQANLEVREAARECLDAVYSDAGETSMPPAAAGAMMSTMSPPPPPPPPPPRPRPPRTVHPWADTRG